LPEGFSVILSSVLAAVLLAVLAPIDAEGRPVFREREKK
jgi:hypothetical protein